MSCKNWKNDDLFCTKKHKTVSYDDLAECTTTCTDYSPLKVVKTDNLLVCPNCCAEFPLTKHGVVEIKNFEHAKCPYCGSTVDLERNDKSLYDNPRY